MWDKAKLGVAAFLFGEGSFFLVLIITYVYYHVQPTAGPTAANSLDTWRTGAFTIALLASSLTVWRAGQGIRAHARGRFRAWMLATLALGAAFLYGEASEWIGLFHKNVTVSRNLFGTTFFTVTGLHGLHVFSGLVALAILLAVNWEAPVHAGQAGVDAAALYWHFVDGVWIVIFAVIYVWAVLR